MSLKILSCFNQQILNDFKKWVKQSLNYQNLFIMSDAGGLKSFKIKGVTVMSQVSRSHDHKNLKFIKSEKQKKILTRLYVHVSEQ